ncbi:MAG: hypothetical protein ACK5H2_11955 [Beutenbergiaceae bacterium]
MSPAIDLPTAWDATGHSGLLGGAVMVYIVDVAPEDEGLLEAWYTHEHLPERVSTPGFLRGRRYRQRDRSAAGQHLTLYEVVDVGVFTSAEYLRRLQSPTELTRAAVAAFVEPQRAVLDVALSHGATSGSELSVLRAPADPAVVDRTRRILPDLFTDRDLTGVHVAATDVAATSAKASTAEGKGAAEGEAKQELLVLVEGTGGTHRAARAIAQECDVDQPVQSYDLLVTLDHHAIRPGDA